MATKKPRTILLKYIRRQIREAIKWHAVDDGMPLHWSTENYKGSRRAPADIEPVYYYVKSSRAIEAIAEKILSRMEGTKNGR